MIVNRCGDNDQIANRDLQLKFISIWKAKAEFEKVKTCAQVQRLGFRDLAKVNWLRQIGAEMVQDSKVTTWGGVAGCQIEARCKGGMRAYSMSSLIVAAGERCDSLGVGFENIMRYWVMKWGAQQGVGVVAFRWLGGRQAKAQGRNMGWGAIACHHCHVFFICLCISAFCLDKEGC